MKHMTMVSVEKEILEDLINHKLRYLREDIMGILKKWNYQSAEPFLKDARSGKIRNAEDDAVVLRNLLDEQDSLTALRDSWK